MTLLDCLNVLKVVFTGLRILIACCSKHTAVALSIAMKLVLIQFFLYSACNYTHISSRISCIISCFIRKKNYFKMGQSLQLATWSNKKIYYLVKRMKIVIFKLRFYGFHLFQELTWTVQCPLTVLRQIFFTVVGDFIFLLIFIRGSVLNN